MLIRSNLTYLNLIFCGPEQTEENWQSQKFTSNYGSKPRLEVVHGSGQILNRVCDDIMQYSQLLLDALGNQE
jgi:hypothetical protein